MNSCHAFKYPNTPFQQRGSRFIKAVTTEASPFMARINGKDYKLPLFNCSWWWAL